ncbi:hypothetical protein [Zoogloea sp.]|jgi:hypothetical protein|uniref:hypothetical protein n=1 Tax=Zoogloea sp. TaxID=49181 RepID=UPI001B400EC8|nr:hypothetical protein [Zoogloea sp.]MBP6762120.1 hypothetical protein [Thauera sp.]MDD3355027.1 hypothetical protein [Zoogloea sp.]
MSNYFPCSRALLELELQALDCDDARVSFRRQRDLLRQRVAAAGDELQRRAVAGELAGLMKRWTRFVIETLTAEALGDARPGRENVRTWQRTLFGKSCASARLARYAKEARSGGGRGEPVQLPDAVEHEARELFARYLERFRTLD